MHFRICILSLLFFTPLFTFAQTSSKRCKWFTRTFGSFEIDSMSVLPGSIKVIVPKDSALSVFYDINTGMAYFDFDSSYTLPDSVQICYTALPYNLSKQFYKRERAIYDTNQFYREKQLFRGYQISDGKNLLNTPGLNKSGSIVRGISFGNNQNVFVNSALNLQMNGRLSDNIGITAVISDQNIPFQPEGNTQQLQDFDKVYIQLHTNRSSLTAGDLVMRNQPGHFLRYYRNVQGGQFEGTYFRDSSLYSTTTVGAAVAKGKFASIQIPALEGVQGPYRLRGPNNEPFIIVLSNSERVFVDGRKLTRGFDFDYTIDYNQAEITFTNNIVITKYSIIRVDFEYSDKNYGRSNLNLAHHQTWKNLTFYVNYFSQRDNPGNPLLTNLSEDQKHQLGAIGDDLSRAVISGADSTGYQENKILYKKIDSLGMPVYVYSINPDEAVYDVAFTNVGEGNGTYTQSEALSNGKIFLFVGAGKGAYLPVRIIPTPQKDQMITAGASYTLSENEKVFGEIAYSQHDINLYSTLDKNNDFGKAVNVGYVNVGKLLPFSSTIKWNASVDFEYTEHTFDAIDRFRDINYERNWSANPDVKAFDRIINASLGLEKNAYNNLTYSISRRIKGNEVNGFQQSYIGNKSWGKLLINSNGFWMFNNRSEGISDWKRFSVNTSWNGKILRPGIIYSMDKNRILNKQKEVIGTAMYYDEMKFFLKSADTTHTRFFSDYAFRTDQDTLLGSIVPVTKSNTFNSGLNTVIKKNHQINLLFTYRFLDYMRGGNEDKDEETFLSRFDWNADLFSRHVRSELTITTGTGRELKKEFFYQTVPQGTGTHVWNDFNGDGLQNLNEFVEKVPGLPYDQQEFIRVFIPTDQYIKAYTGTFNYRLDLTAPRNWRNSKKKWKGFVSKFSSSSSWSVNKKVLDPNLWNRFNPVDNTDENSLNVLSTQKAMRATLFFNRTNPKYGMDLLYGINESKSLLMQGFESNINKEITYSARANVKQFYNIKLTTGYDVKSTRSDFLSLQNFIIESYTFAPEFAWQPKNNIRFTGSVSYTDKKNIYYYDPGEKVKLYEAGLEGRFNAVSQRTFSASLKYIKIFADLKTTSLNSPVAYEMLDALRPGDNFTWSISWQEKLLNGLQLSFIYEGRKSEATKTIHTGRMQASAFF